MGHKYQFVKVYEFQHKTNNPHFSQSNGEAERIVQTIKRMLKRSDDEHLAILSYRATPMPWCGLSPSELCMGRRLRTTVPQISQQLIPHWPHMPAFPFANQQFKQKQHKNFARRHRVREQSDIPEGLEVWITTDNHPSNPPNYL